MDNPQQYQALEQEAIRARAEANSVQFDTSRGPQLNSSRQGNSKHENKKRFKKELVDENNHRIAVEEALKPVPLNNNIKIVVDSNKQPYSKGPNISSRRIKTKMNSPLFNLAKRRQFGFGFRRIEINSLGGDLRSDRLKARYSQLNKKNRKILEDILRKQKEKNQRQIAQNQMHNTMRARRF